jgi:hypothetical protein
MKVALPRGPGFKRFAAGASNSYFVISGMNLWLHAINFLLDRPLKRPLFKQAMIEVEARIVKLCGHLRL